VTERLGIDYQTVRARNERLIYCSISGFGRTGPRRTEAAYDAIMQAFVGIMASTGTPGSEPIRVGLSICDIGAAMYANQAILLALAARARTGRGQLVEASLFESQIAWLLYRAVGYFATGSSPAGKYGAGAPHVVPYDAYPTADGHIIVGALNDGLFRRMAATIGLPDLAEDPRFATNPLRVAHRDELIALLESHFATDPAEHWLELLSGAGVPSGKVRSMDDVYSWDQTLSQGLLLSVQHATQGELRLPGSPVRFDDNPFSGGRSSHAAPPTLGQHNESIRAWLDEG
jgi:crotonobetainyl-CoA:carnitine CoA-transferase CaiB-like acyl-CoA transferase